MIGYKNRKTKERNILSIVNFKGGIKMENKNKKCSLEGLNKRPHG
jgi:hypothetical protein